MDFRERLAVRASAENGFRLYEPLMTRSGVSISVQASQFHYCEPRRTEDLSVYSEVEIGILADVSTFPPDFPGADLRFEVQPGLSVAGFVPVDRVQAIVDYLDLLPA